MEQTNYPTEKEIDNMAQRAADRESPLYKLGYAESCLKAIVAILNQNSFKNKGITTTDAEYAKSLAYRALENIKGASNE